MSRWGAAIAALLVAGSAVLAAAPASIAQPVDPCAGWEVRTLVSGLGLLENLEPDGRGGLLLSTSRDRVERLFPDGSVEVAYEDLPSPGGLRVRDGHLFVNTGSTLQAGLLGTSDGTIQRIDLETGARETWAEGLVMPNGLVLDGEGRAFTSRDLGADGAITVVPAEPPRTPARFAEIRDTNGLAIDSSGRWLYAATTFDPTAPVHRVRLDDPSQIELVASLALVGVPIAKGLDDMTFDAADVLYLTANGTSELLRLDPATGDACVIAGGLGNPTAVKLGDGPGWDPTHLYVTAWDGAVREIVPPPGAEPTPFPEDVPPTVPPAPADPEEPGAGRPEADTGAAPLPTTGGGVGIAGPLLLAAALRIRGRRAPGRAARGSG